MKKAHKALKVGVKKPIEHDSIICNNVDIASNYQKDLYVKKN